MLVALVWSVAAVVMTWKLAGRAADDFFITFRYAWNLAHGHGLVFNPGERVFGLTNPGLALLLAAAHATLAAPIHWLGTAVMAVGLVSLAVLLLLEAGRSRCQTEAIIGGCLVLFSSYIWANHGAAAPAVLLLLVLAARWADAPGRSGLAAGAAVWFRPDAILAVAALGALLWWQRRRPPWHFAVVAAALTAVGAVAAWIYYGSPLPNTLLAKRLMAEANPESWSGARFWLRALRPFSRHWGWAWPAIPLLGFAGLPWLWRDGSLALRVLLVYGLAVSIAYPLLGVPFYIWYSVPVVVVILYGVAYASIGTGRRLPEKIGATSWRRPLVVVLSALVLAIPACSVLPASYRWFSGFSGFARYDAYRRVGLWLADHSRQDERVATTEIGAIGYYGRRPMEDLMGLVTPHALPFVVVNDMTGAFLARPAPLVVMHNRSRMLPLLDQPWFESAYREVARFAASGPASEVMIFRRLPEAVLPAPGLPAP